MTRQTPVVLGSLISLIAVGSAGAEFTGISWAEVDSNGATDLTIDVFAHFNNPNDVLIAVAGTASTTMDLQVTNGSFYQNAFGGDMAPNQATIDAFPSLAYDTFVTIGKLTSTGDQTGLTPGWPGFQPARLGGPVDGNNLAWFITPDQPQGSPVDGKVLLARLSARASGGDPVGISGEFLLQSVSEGNPNYQVAVAFSTSLPGDTVLDGEQVADKFGTSIATLGDLDDDGYEDFIVGAPLNDHNGTDAGRVYVYSGYSGALLFTRQGQKPGNQFGFSVAGVGDVNDDGIPDFAVGAPLHGSKKGAVYVYSGANAAKLYKVLGDKTGDRLGYAIAPGPDVDDDGRPDVLAGAPYADPNGSQSGALHILSGADGDTIEVLEGEATKDRFGWSVALIGRITSDSIDDFIVGAPFSNEFDTDAGKAYVFNGATRQVIRTHLGRTAADRFGHSVAGVDRIDGDTRDDYAIGAPLYDKNGHNNRGRIDVYDGKDGDRIWAKSGPRPGERDGSVIAAAGDVNGDGWGDVISGAPRHHVTGIGGSVGRVYVRSGVDGSTLATFTGTAMEDYLGEAVAGLSDLNADGSDELLVGTPGQDDAGVDAGQVMVLAMNTEETAGTSGTESVLVPADLPGWRRFSRRFDVVSENRITDSSDVIAVLAAWGACEGGTSGWCQQDLDHDGRVGISDLIIVINSWTH